MCFKGYMAMPVAAFLLLACTSYREIRQIRAGEVTLGLSVPEREQPEEKAEEIVIDSIINTLSDGSILMNAIRDTETGEMVATDVINASKVVAKFRNVAERAGWVSIGFDVMVPSEMVRSQWRLKISPQMRVQDDTVMLDDVFITGKEYREAQLRGYQRYRRFIESIVTDMDDLVRIGQLEIFIKRHFPETFAMKNDSSYVSEPMAENLFGVTQQEAARHFTKHLKYRRNEWKKKNSDRMFAKFVKDPIDTRGVRLDTVLATGGTFIYRYTHTFRSRPGLKKVFVTLEGSLYERGECLAALPFPEDLTFYISSLSSLADMGVRYRMIVLERAVYDNTKAFIDFAGGSARLDTTLMHNSSELKRLRKCVRDVVEKKDFVLDSLLILATCSPEGSYEFNRKLSSERSMAVLSYMEEFVPDEWHDKLKSSCLPENWKQLRLLVENDTVMGGAATERILRMTRDLKRPDEVERRLASLPQYRYLRERIYPKLRTVSFDFYLHRDGMVKDTVHTMEVDTVYMNGLEALKNMDYKRAVSLLRPYRDYNSALACMSADYNHSALDILQEQDSADPKVCYLKAMVFSRLGLKDEAKKYYSLAVAYDPSLVHRANLDPELYGLLSDMN